MDRGFRILCQSETRRLLTLLGVIAILVLVVQYAELPYGKMLSLIPSIRKISNSQIETSLGYSQTEGINNNDHSNASSIHAFEAMPRSPTYEGSTNSIMAPPSGIASETKNFTASNVDFTSQEIEPPSFVPQPVISLGSETKSRSPTIFVPSNATSVKTDATKQANNNDMDATSVSRKDNSRTAKTSKKPPSKVVSMSEMNLMLQQSRASSKSNHLM